MTLFLEISQGRIPSMANDNLNNPANAHNAHLQSTPIWTPPLPPKDQQRLNRQRPLRSWLHESFKGKTLWDYLDLMAALAVPVMIAVGTLWFTTEQSQASANATAMQSQAAATASAKQHQNDLSNAQDQQQETALQMYLDRISDLLLTNHLASSQPGDEVRQVARARTLTLLPQLNATRKREVILFLYEGGLLQRTAGQTQTIVYLGGADLRGVDLSSANLNEANLGGANLEGSNLNHTQLEGSFLMNADLKEANLDGVDLIGANLSYATLTHADLNGASLRGASLRAVDLSYATLNFTDLGEADLFGADLSYATLTHADLTRADLRRAYLSYADLRNAKGTTSQQLHMAADLSGTTMPDGTKHP
jgi:uncharacterized protein YjbI with pentapeptide repeats